MKKMTLRERFHIINVIEQDVDIYVDGIDGMAVCYPVTLTDEGEKKFGSVLDMVVEGNCIVGNDDDYTALDDYEDEVEGANGGRLVLAWKLIKGLAGYCSSSNYDKWFEGGKEL